MTRSAASRRLLPRIVRFFAPLFAVTLVVASVVASPASFAASGVRPEISVLLVSEETGQAQMSLINEESRPMLLHSLIKDVPEDTGPSLLSVTPVSRVEPKARQIARFVLEPLKEPLKVQHYKRVTFEGIPPSEKKEGTARIEMTVRYDLPVIISPKGMVQHEAPWELLKWSVAGNKLTVHNPSPYVVRMSREVDLMPAAKRFEAVNRTFILPGDTLTVELPQDTRPESIAAVRLFPASLYGATVDPFDAPVSR